MDETFVAHIGWVAHEAGDEVGLFLRQGWYEWREQAFWWLYLRGGDVVVDCGAHVGLFSLLASKAMGGAGKIVAIEPSSATGAILRENLRTHEAGQVEVVNAAAGAAAGRMSLGSAVEGRSAYAHMSGDVQGGEEVAVARLDDLIGQRGLGRVALMKLDVEGAELDALAGAAGLLESGAVGVLMIEVNEQNLRRGGHTTKDLFEALEARGYTLYEMDAAEMQLVQRHYVEPIWYENLFATKDVHAVNARLASADAERRRIARDIALAGAARARLVEVNQIEEKLAEALRERALYQQRMTDVMAWHKQSTEWAKRSDERYQETAAKLAAAMQKLVDSERKAGAAEARVEELRERVTSAEARLQAVTEDLQGQKQQVQELTGQLCAAQRRAEVASAEANEMRSRLYWFCVSKYERASWAVGLRRKPAWVDEIVARKG